MSNYRQTFSINSNYEVNGLSRTAYTIADRFQTECKIDREVIKTGWFSKRYEYHITYSGDKVNVLKAVHSMNESVEAYNKRIQAIDETENDNWW